MGRPFKNIGNKEGHTFFKDDLTFRGRGEGVAQAPKVPLKTSLAYTEVDNK